MTAKINVQVAYAMADDESLRTEWSRLFRSSPHAPFLAWEYSQAWQRSFGGDSSPYILKAYRNDEVIGLLPLRRSASGSGSLAFIGDGNGADHLDLIASAEDRDAVAAAFAEHLCRSDVSAAVLDQLSSVSPLRPALRAAASRLGLRYFERESYICPYIDLTYGWHAILNDCRRKSNFLRRLKKLETVHGFNFRSLSLPGDVGHAFERFLGLHQNRWAAGHAVSDLTRQSSSIDFNRAVVDQMAETGLLRFDELWLGSECVASIFGFDDGRTFQLFNSGYDPEWADRSVGLVLLGMSIRAACDRGRTKYDFLRGDESYKFDWTRASETLVKACLVNNTLAGRAFAAREGLIHHARDIARRLPPVARDRIKSWRYGESRSAASA